MRDGYHTARVERYDDDDSDEDNDLKVEKEFGQVINHNKSALVSRSTESMVREASQFGKQLQRSNVPWILQRIIRTNSKMPSDASSLSWWMAATIPIDDQEKLQILELTSARDRLSLVCEWINEVKKQWWFQPLIHGSPIPQ
jgi:Lon protease-like protein